MTAGRDSIEEDDGGWNYALQVATAELISFIAHQYLRDPSRKIVEHLKLTFNRNQGSTISEWWRAFIKRIKESVTVKCNCYQISEETERELVSIFPSYSQDLNLFTISNQEAGLCKLDIYVYMTRVNQTRLCGAPRAGLGGMFVLLSYDICGFHTIYAAENDNSHT